MRETPFLDAIRPSSVEKKYKKSLTKLRIHDKVIKVIFGRQHISGR